MPPRSRTPRKLGPVDIEVLRTRLEAGGRVRVGIRASGQFPDGAVGMVRRIGDPTTDGVDFVQVETSIGGVKDVLPFAPADLVAPPARGAARAVPSSAGTAPSRGGSVGRAASESAAFESAAFESAASGSTAPGRALSGTAGAASTGGAVPGTARAGKALIAPAADVTKRSRSPIAGSAVAKPSAAEASQSSRPGPLKSSAATGRARLRRAPVTMTIATTEDDTAPWTVEARIGARVSLKATPVSPARVWEIVKTLGEPRLTALVESLLAEHRKATQARADALTRELAAVRAELRAYPDADS